MSALTHKWQNETYSIQKNLMFKLKKNVYTNKNNENTNITQKSIYLRPNPSR